MLVREKMIELLDDIQRCGEDYTDCEIYGIRIPDTVSNEVVTDHLIANGVTVRERGQWETTEVTEEWETVERFHHFHRECKYSYCDNGLGGHYFCPNCGADMRGEEDGNAV